MFSRSSRFFALLAVLLAGSIVEPLPVFAQDTGVQALGVTVSTAGAPAVPLVARAAPVFVGTSSVPSSALVAGSPFGEVAANPALDVVAVQDRVRAGPNIAMMAVGGAALVIGLAMGGDNGMIIATAGGVIGLVGLYRYLR